MVKYKIFSYIWVSYTTSGSNYGFFLRQLHIFLIKQSFVTKIILGMYHKLPLFINPQTLEKGGKIKKNKTKTNLEN